MRRRWSLGKACATTTPPLSATCQSWPIWPLVAAGFLLYAVWIAARPAACCCQARSLPWAPARVEKSCTIVMAVGMALIYRANRVVNFAQAELGTVPTSFAAAFIIFWVWPYLLGFAAGLVLSVLAGVVIEFALIRRFRNSPRLVVTVATLGITQLLVVIGILIPRWWGRNLASERIAPPFDFMIVHGVVNPASRKDDDRLPTYRSISGFR